MSSVWLSLQGKQTQVKAKLHRLIIGTVKTCTVHSYGKKGFVCFSVDQEDTLLPPCADAIGLDAGLNSFMALSRGEFIDNPRFFHQDEKALAKAGRKQAKTAQGSKPRKEANKVLRRIHERIRNRRHNFVHQTARRLVNRFGMIAVEKLSVKAESAGREVIAVDPRHTSQNCHACGYRATKKLSDRWHLCPMCGASLCAEPVLTKTPTPPLTFSQPLRDNVASDKSVEAPPFRAGALSLAVS